MPITVQNLHDRLRPYVEIHVPEENQDRLLNADYLRIFNAVARDLNAYANIHVERFYKKTNATNAEDSDLTNYLVQRKIIKVFELRYESSAYEDQYYTYINDRLILKVAPEDEAILDLLYLGDTEDASELTDEIDIPDAIVDDYEQLIKIKIRIDYGGLTNVSYEESLKYWANKAQRKKDRPPLGLGEVKNHMMLLDGDGDIYNITNNYIGIENFISDVNGNYSWVDAD